VLRIGVLCSLVLLACACGGGDDGSESEEPVAPPPKETSTNLQITIWPSGRDGPYTQWTLTCPPGGSLPNAAAACRRLNALGNRAFAPTPKDVVCADIYGGPQVAEVKGSFQGGNVDARYTRTNACEIERWERVKFLLASSGPT
jgi:subtilisin inhibitor-like